VQKNLAIIGRLPKRKMPLLKSQPKRTLNGESAHREISSKLSGHPLAQRLAQEVYDFYGPCLAYEESRHFQSTIFSIHLQQDPIAIKSAEIQLQLGTERIAEALVHELLHLRLPKLGFPLGEIVRIPFPLDPHARDLLGMCHWVLNLVQHEINYPSFMALGFDRKHFLAMPGETKDYQRIFDGQFRNGGASELSFPWWCMEYLGHFFSARHGCDHNSLDQAWEALKWGSRLHPELGQITAEIKKRVEIGAFKDPGQYAGQANLLLGLMRIPKFISWVMLNLSGPQKPTAIRVEAIAPLRCGMNMVIPLSPGQ
jgi:hypothetical protein